MKIFRGLIVMALPLVCAVSQGTANQNDAATSPTWRVKRIAFESRIWSINLGRLNVDQGEISALDDTDLDGTGIQKIAENNHADLFDPSFSPDGKQLVAQGIFRAGGENPATGTIIFLSDVSAEQITRLAHGRSPSVVWEKRAIAAQAASNKLVPSLSTPSNQSLIAQGKARYLDYKCGECHGANGEGGGEGPDLIGTRLNAEEISKFLEKPSPDAYMKGMPNVPKDSPDHQALVAYVVSLKRSSNLTQKR